MGININTNTGSGRYSVALPDASLISVPAVAKAAVAAKEAEAEYNAQRREHEAAEHDVNAAKGIIAIRAADLKIKKKKLGIEILAPLREAEAALELAKVGKVASERAFEHAYSVLIAELNANRAELVSAAVTDSDMALQRLAAARVAFESAARSAHASFGILGMFAEDASGGALSPVLRDRRGSKRNFFTTVAIDALSEAVGANALELDGFKRGEVSTELEVEDADEADDED